MDYHSLIARTDIARTDRKNGSQERIARTETDRKNGHGRLFIFWSTPMYIHRQFKVFFRKEVVKILVLLVIVLLIDWSSDQITDWKGIGWVRSHSRYTLERSPGRLTILLSCDRDGIERRGMWYLLESDPHCQIKFCHRMQNIFNEIVLQNTKC